jgi:hypothetical protein
MLYNSKDGGTKMNKHLIWATTIFLIVAMLCGTLIWINHNSWTMRFEMDDNTKEAIQSLNFSDINTQDESVKNPYEDCNFDGCNYVCESTDGISISTLRYCHNISDNYKQIIKEDDA